MTLNRKDHHKMSVEEKSSHSAPALVIDLGSKSRKKIRRLKKNKGSLVADVENATELIKSSMGAEAEGKILVPVVFVYRKKQKKRKRNKASFPFPFRF